ncbi:MAG: glycine zipper family protein [Alphaproteobacteria bacterium]
MRTSLFSAIAVLLGASILLSACASTSYNPVIDTKKVNMDKYQNDLAECRRLADQVDVAGDTATDTAIGAVAGAAGGALLGAITGNAGTGAAIGAAAGGLGGAGTGAISSNQRQKNIINNCLKGRGYKVLG